MTTSLYKEAIVEAKKLKELAEENAKKAILESLTPKIKELIDTAILNEALDEDDSDLLEDVAQDLLRSSNDAELNDSLSKLRGTKPEVEIDYDEFAKSHLRIDDISTQNYPKDFGGTIDQPEVILTKESADALLKLSSGNLDYQKDYKKILASFNLSKQLMNSDLKESKNTRSFLTKSALKMITDIRLLESKIIRINESSKENDFSNILESVRKTHKEIVDMSKRLAEMYESEGWLDEIELVEDDELDFDVDSGEDMDDMEAGDDLDLDVDVDSESDVDVQAAKSALEDLAAALGLSVESADEDMEDLELSDSEEESDEDESEEEEEEEDELEESEEEDDDEMLEIDEAMLRSELARMMSLREGDAADPKVVDDFGGAKKVKEVFVDGDDKDLNKHDKVSMKEARVNRTLLAKLAEAKKVNKALQTKLEESQLFSAKLLYMNKLLNEKDLTDRQKQTVVEGLNGAQTLREVRLLHKSFSASLEDKSSSLYESKQRKSGSSSRLAKPASIKKPLNESADLDTSRWAILAGIQDSDE